MYCTPKILTLGFLLLLVLKNTHQQCLSNDDTRQDPNPKGRLEFYNGQQEFSLAMLKAVNQLTPNDNIFFSPYSTFHALSIAYFLSGGETEKYLKNMLKFSAAQEKIDIYNAFKLDKFLTGLNARNSSYEFSNANKIYVSDQVEVKACVQEIFPYELEAIAFRANPELARTHINQWVENNTHNIIKNLLPPGSVDPTTSLALVNAAYFKGMWENKFDPKATRPDVFYVSPSKQITVDMMFVEATFNHDVSETLGAHILELPYEGKDVSMYILLPPFAKVGAIDETLKKMNLDQLKQIVEGKHLIGKTVQVYLPKFSLEHTIELVPILETLGVGNLFQGNADFSVLSNKNRVTLGEGIHKAKIIINEKGAEAAAATALIGWRMADEDDDTSPPVVVKCNQPFAFFIYNKKSKTVLFASIIRSPMSSK